MRSKGEITFYIILIIMGIFFWASVFISIAKADEPTCPEKVIIKKEVVQVDRVIELPYYITKYKVRRNRLTLLGGVGPDRDLKVALPNISLDNTFLTGLQYQRLVTDRVSVGVMGLSNGTGAVSIGWEW